jgi:Diguanylate cyclase, GGDEF domain
MVEQDGGHDVAIRTPCRSSADGRGTVDASPGDGSRSRRCGGLPSGGIQVPRPGHVGGRAGAGQSSAVRTEHLRALPAADRRGDEFAIILEALIADADARGTAERVIDQVQQPIDVDGSPARVSASVGIAVHQHNAGADDTLRRADAAMYAAKAAGKNRYVEATA